MLAYVWGGVNPLGIRAYSGNWKDMSTYIRICIRRRSRGEVDIQWYNLIFMPSTCAESVISLNTIKSNAAMLYYFSCSIADKCCPQYALGTCSSLGSRLFDVFHAWKTHAFGNSNLTGKCERF